jgi:hypothetical protein
VAVVGSTLLAIVVVLIAPTTIRTPTTTLLAFVWFLFSLGGNFILPFKQKELCHKGVRQGSSGAETDERLNGKAIEKIMNKKK